ncbi:MAG: histidine phosphatase family protein [Gemmatirosa sp.]
MPAPTAPAALWLVRHGESAANVARNAALATGAPEIALTHSDLEVPLSPLGERQATALGRWFAERPEEERPTVVVASPYARARRTAELVVARLDGFAAPLVLDERWREKELGLFYTLTRHGVEQRFPEQWELRQRLGHFYYRPPNGESGADVAFRVRAALDAVIRDYPGERVLVVCHQIVILCTRYVLDRLDEEGLAQLWRQYDLANCSVTTYRPDGTGRLALTRYNFTVPLIEEGAPVTTEPAHATRPA